MKRMPVEKYRPYPAADLPDRVWPSAVIRRAPRWCSVDLRDGNQALITPMGVEQKLRMFRLLVDMGFKEIEVGFPSASKVEYDFIRLLTEEGMIPSDVTVQVLTQAREPLIKKTVEALRGVGRAILHLYNSTSTLQRRVVFRMGRRQIMDLAVRGAEMAGAEAARLQGTEVLFEYSPESFTGTEEEFALEVCEAVLDIWRPTESRKVILNLPSTVEMATPNVYADRIERFCRHISRRKEVIISAHAHNDRGTAVAATELALMAGAERVEGTLFGNGERTGNVDIVTLALNMFSQGVDPELDLHDINGMIGIYESCTRIPVHARHPYAGELVYTAFSGSHQDAINKGMKACNSESSPYWEVPYLPIDPADVGRTYESIIRINSQSGKGGIAYVMEHDFGFSLPGEMQPEFGAIIQSVSDRTGQEILPAMIWDIFQKEYLLKDSPLSFSSCRMTDISGDGVGCGSGTEIRAVVAVEGKAAEISGSGNGPIDAFSNALKKDFDIDFSLLSYHEHALDMGSDSRAAAYIRIDDGQDLFFGAGVDTNIDVASFRALVSALNRSPRFRELLGRLYRRKGRDLV